MPYTKLHVWYCERSKRNFILFDSKLKKIFLWHNLGEFKIKEVFMFRKLCAILALAFATFTFESFALACDFNQTVLKPDGSKVSSSEGSLKVMRPSHLMMHTKTPDEQYLFTRGNEVYFFDPFVNQVSIFNRDDLNTTPFLLLNSDDESLWDQYDISSNGNEFSLKPLKKSDIKSFSLVFDKEILSSIKILMKDGNLNIYNLKNQSKNVSLSDFNFEIPSDAEVDDERSFR